MYIIHIVPIRIYYLDPTERSVLMFNPKDLPAGVDDLHEERGSGYETRDVLRLLSNMNAELKALEECWKLKSWNKSYSLPEPYRNTPLRAARVIGYNAAAVSKLVSELDYKIKQMRAKLNVERDRKNWNQEWYTAK